MSKPFDMELFLASVLTGSHATRERHLRQAKAIQAAMSNRWHRDNPLDLAAKASRLVSKSPPESAR